MQCSVVRRGQQCTKVAHKDSLCKYHSEGGCMLKRNMFFDVESETWQTGIPPTPQALKYENGNLYRYDSKQWRKVCELCDRYARPVYCSAHNPKNKPSNLQNGFSKLACRFLDELSDELQVPILHKHLEEDGTIQWTEYSIPKTKYRVDGWIYDRNTVVEVLGDFWHGNPSVNKFHEFNKITNSTFEELFKVTFARLEILSNLGYEVWYVWENDILSWSEELGIPLMNIVHKYGEKSTLLN